MIRKLTGSLDRTPTTELEQPPWAVTDDADREVWLRAYDSEWFEALVGMYERFDPEGRAQGIPPVEPAPIRAWLRTVLAGPSVVAVHDGAIVGHVMFTPDDDGGHELAIFVDSEYRHAGVGTALLRAGLGHAQSEGVDDVWLQVGGSNLVAQRLYRKLDFRFDGPTGLAFRMSRTL